VNEHDQVQEQQETPNWGSNTPRGGRAVMNRILKERATVPLFFAQTLIQSLRDVGYNNTTSALCEHVDNAIQASASEIRIYFHQRGKVGSCEIDTLVLDNGAGMAPNILKVATSFGGSMNLGNRDGIARFGMGMKTAALSLSPTLEIYSWQEPAGFYAMSLDVEEIGKDRSNLVELPDPTFANELSPEIVDLLTKPLSHPSNQSEQSIFASRSNLIDRLGSSGTIVYMPDCDRLTYAKSKTLADHATKEMARIYRRFIADGLKLYVNNRRVDAFDPTYSMSNARHVSYLQPTEPHQSTLVTSKVVPIRVAENTAIEESITIKLFRLPIEAWSKLPRKTLRNDLRVFDSQTVSILRNDREVFCGGMPKITTRHNITNWYRLQIDFSGRLDEAFGVAANKQGVRLKGYVEDAIKHAVGDEIATINDELKRFQSAQAAVRAPATPTASESKANEADPFIPQALPSLTQQEEAQLDANLRGLAATVRRDGETDEEAFQRLKNSKYVIQIKHDKYWPFYDVQHRFGRVILTINTAHPFYTELYEPVSRASSTPSESDEDDVEPRTATVGGPIVALELLLLSLARTQSRLESADDDARPVLEQLRREWSEALRLQLTV
jgi:hypothetical protein